MMKLQVKILHGVLENYNQTNQLDNQFIKISACKAVFTQKSPDFSTLRRSLTECIGSELNNGYEGIHSGQTTVSGVHKRFIQNDEEQVRSIPNAQGLAEAVVQMKQGELKAPFTHVPSQKNRLPPLPTYKLDQQVKRIQSPSRSAAKAKKNKSFLAKLSNIAPKVYDFMEEEKAPPRIFISDSSISNENSELKPSINISRFSNPKGESILDTSIEQSPFSFNHGSPGNFASDCRGRYSTGKKSSRTVVVSPSTRDRQNSNDSNGSILEKVTEPRSFGRKVKRLRSDKDMISKAKSLGQESEEGSKSPHLNDLQRKYGNVLSMSRTLNRVNPLTISMKNYSSAKSCKTKILIPPTVKDQSLITSEVDSFNPRRVSALEKALSRGPSRGCQLIKPNVASEKKTHLKIKEIAQKVHQRLYRGDTQEEERTIRAKKNSNSQLHHSILSQTLQRNPTVTSLRQRKLFTMFDSPEMTRRDDSHSLLGHYKSAEQPSFKRNDQITILNEGCNQDDKSMIDYLSTHSNTPAYVLNQTSYNSSEKLQIDRYLQYQQDANRLNLETEILLKKRPKSIRRVKEIKRK